MLKNKYEAPHAEVMKAEPILPLAGSIPEDNDAESKRSTFDYEDMDMWGFGVGVSDDADAEWTWK